MAVSGGSEPRSIHARYRRLLVAPHGIRTGLLDRINASCRIWLSSTMLRGRFTIRACILCHRTHRDRVEEAGQIIRRAVQDVAAGR